MIDVARWAELLHAQWSVVGREQSTVEAQWSTVVAGGFVVVDGQGSTLDA